MKSIEELIEESIREIENNEKPIKQVFDEFFNILTYRHNKRIEDLDNQRLVEYKQLKNYINLIQRDINSLRSYFDELSINNIKHQLEDISKLCSNCL
jgi:serine/threonine-protein kinase RIO1